MKPKEEVQRDEHQDEDAELPEVGSIHDGLRRRLGGEYAGAAPPRLADLVAGHPDAVATHDVAIFSSLLVFILPMFFVSRMAREAVQEAAT